MDCANVRRSDGFVTVTARPPVPPVALLPKPSEADTKVDRNTEKRKEAKILLPKSVENNPECNPRTRRMRVPPSEMERKKRRVLERTYVREGVEGMQEERNTANRRIENHGDTQEGKITRVLITKCSY